MALRSLCSWVMFSSSHLASDDTLNDTLSDERYQLSPCALTDTDNLHCLRRGWISNISVNEVPNRSHIL